MKQSEAIKKLGLLENEISEFKEQLSLHNDEVDELEKQLSVYEDDVKELEKQLSIYEDIIDLNVYFSSLNSLTTFEYTKFEEFRASYNDNVLKGLEPITICKMYLLSGRVKDYETQYEFYTTNEELILMTKDEFINESDNSVLDYDIFNDVYNLETRIDADGLDATIIWKSKNGHYADPEGYFTYGFSLTKDGEVWKVSFVPMN